MAWARERPPHDRIKPTCREFGGVVSPVQLRRVLQWQIARVQRETGERRVRTKVEARASMRGARERERVRVARDPAGRNDGCTSHACTM